MEYQRIGVSVAGGFGRSFAVVAVAVVVPAVLGLYLPFVVEVFVADVLASTMRRDRRRASRVVDGLNVLRTDLNGEVVL